LQHINFNVEQGSNAIENAIKAAGKEVDWEILRKKEKEVKSELLGLYKEYEEGKSDKLSEFGEYKELILDKLKDIERGDISIRSAYGDFKEQFDKAYESASEENKKRLKEFSNEIQPKIKELKTNPAKIVELKEALQKGIHLLHSIKAPEVLKPLREFAIDKASETFSNLACESYKKFGESSPIISIENPPAGGGLSRGKDLKELVEKAREKFKEKAIKELGLSKEKAKEEAEKLIGVTWDVGHINMLRKYGYTEEELEEETRKIAEFAKHVHLSDNFGMEHTELPMGMGNVPSEQMLKILGEYNKKLKKIAETGDWYQHFQISPLADVLSHYKSPIYAMQNAPYWSQETVGQMGAYFGGYGTNPDIHHATYGAGFSGLPPELGGQMGKSRLSGAPID
ncbi:MAG: hypothetical protein QXD13_01520, partial [Candidatus Pacearchaeota archaeon]